MARIRSTLAAAFDIRSGDGLPLTLLLIHSFFQGLSLVFLETPANTLFLQRFSVETLPYVYILTAVVSILLGLIYARLEARIPPARLLLATLIFLTVTNGLFYLALLLNEAGWLVMGLMIWKDVLWVLAGIEFWAVAGFLFNVRQGKRLFGLMGAGEVTAGILGGFSVPLIVSYIGTLNLLLIATVSLCGSLVMLIYTLRVFAVRFAAPADQTETEKDNRPISRLIRERYLFLFFATSILSYLAFFYIDYVFYDRVESAFPDENQLASFFGVFFAVLGIVELLSRAFVSGRLLTRFGLSFGLLALPVINAFATGFATISALVFGAAGVFLWAVVVTKLLDEVCRGAVQTPALRILYQPLPAGKRLRIQAIRESIVEPLAIGLAGASLLLFTSVLTFSALQLLYIVLALLAACIALSVLLRREYTVVLMNALTQKRFRGLFISLEDQSSLTVLQERLESDNTSEVIYCLNMLEENEHESLNAALLKLLDHSEPKVRQHVLERIEHLRVNDALEQVSLRVAFEPVPAVRGQALRTLCALGESDVFERVPPYLDHPEAEVRKGAMVGLLRSCGIDGVLSAGNYLNHLLVSPDAADRKLAAEVLGDVGIVSFYQPLLRLLRDDDLEVRKVALEAAGEVKNGKLAPMMIENLSFMALRGATVSALVQSGEAVVPELEAAFERAEQPRATRIRIAQVCGRIGGEHAGDVLSRHVNYPDEAVREQVLLSLVMCNRKPEDYDTDKIAAAISDEVEDAAWTLAAIADINLDETTTHITQALKHELMKNQERICLLLSFICHAKSMLQAKANLANGSPEKRAGALEVIDNIVGQKIKQMIFPILDDLPQEERLARLQELFPQPRMERAERLRQLLLRSPVCSLSWTKLCVMQWIGRGRASGFTDCLVAFLDDPEPVMRETAAWSLHESDPASYRNYAERLLHDPHPLVRRAAQGLAVKRLGVGSVV